jgi:hypothetical protein
MDLTPAGISSNRVTLRVCRDIVDLLYPYNKSQKSTTIAPLKICSTVLDIRILRVR